MPKRREPEDIASGPKAKKIKFSKDDAAEIKPKRREPEDIASGHKAKKIKFAQDDVAAALNLNKDEIEFPRGGGTTLTPLEYKHVRAEAVKEADAELVFENSESRKKIKRGQKSWISDVRPSKKQKDEQRGDSKGDVIRVEHLNYKRVIEGMKIFCQIIAVRPLALIVSLPGQLFGHIPITQISTQFTKQLEALDKHMEGLSDRENEAEIPRAPELFEMFRVGQYLRAVVTGVQPAGASASGVIGLNRRMDENERASQRVELSIIPEHVNKGVSKTDLTSGFILPAVIQSVEDHGYILDFGISKISGFLSFEDAKKGPYPERLPEGLVLDVCISSVSENKRTCKVSIDVNQIVTTSMSEITSVTSILPGTLVQALVTAVDGSGLNVQLLGYFTGTINPFHLPSGDISSRYKLGDKVKARILWEISSTEPRQFALSLLPHVINLDTPRLKSDQPHQEAFPVGTILDAVRVLRVEAERGLVMQIQDNVLGYVHIRHVSDDHIPSLSPSSGHWKVNTVHRARVIGFQALDGILQLSLQPSVLEQKFLQVQDVEIGEVLKATVKKLTDKGLFVSLSGSVQGVIWPKHYADIALRHPQKRFKEGSTIKCRVLTVNADQKRLALTAKKTLVESDLPIIGKLDDAKVGMVTHAVIHKVLTNAVLVEFYNNLNALVSAHEASETPVPNLSEAFPIGKPVKVRITHIDREAGRMQASIRQAISKTVEVPDISDIQVNAMVEGTIKAIHKEHVAITLTPTNVTALLSIKSFANSRNTTEAQLRASLTVGEKINNLVVRSRNPDKGIVIVVVDNKASKSKPSKKDIKKDMTKDIKKDVKKDIEREGVTAMEVENVSGRVTESIPGNQNLASEPVKVESVVSGHVAKPVSGKENITSKPVEAENVVSNLVTETVPTMKIPGGFRWSAQSDTQEADPPGSTSEEDSYLKTDVGSSKKKKKAIEYDLTADMHTRQPESTADFERLLLGSPNSSYLWVQYMSFQLQLSEIEKAKEIGKRALETINFREEGEKMNVWIALLNLENKYGTDESLDAVFKDAARHNDSKAMHLRLASIFAETGRHDRAVEQHQKTCKKFGKSSKVWTLFGEYYFKQGEQEAARQLLPRSLQSLEKRKHLKTITKFAQMEYKLGDPERGRTIFEGIIDSHSKRWDLWSVYVDMETTQKNIQAIRNIFDRVLALKMTSHKAKAFFKKWLELEKRLGDEDGENAVKAKAVEWTRKASAGASK